MGTAAEPAEPDEEALPDRLPYWVIIIDELADLMLTAQQDIEPRIQKLTQLARATGIHMIIATQRPTVDIITGTIKSNIPGRVAFKVAQKNDSRVVLDQEGADKLVGKGDMLVLTGANKLIRAQGAWTKDEEIQAIADHWKRQGKPRFDNRLQAKIEGRRRRGSAGGAGRGRGAHPAGDRSDPPDAAGEHVVDPAAAADRLYAGGAADRYSRGKGHGRTSARIGSARDPVRSGWIRRAGGRRDEAEEPQA
jgi:DNA segregation ATPase FtsK/SpoIIIE-like protein